MNATNPLATNPLGTLTISEYIETPNGKELRRLLKQYRNRDTIKTTEALSFLCISELYFCLFEGSIDPDDFILPPGFHNIPAEKVMKGFESWATSDYCSDILSLNRDYHYTEFEAAIHDVMDDTNESNE